MRTCPIFSWAFLPSASPAVTRQVGRRSLHWTYPDYPPRTSPQVLIYLPLCASASHHPAGAVFQSCTSTCAPQGPPGARKSGAARGGKCRLVTYRHSISIARRAARCRCRHHMRFLLMQVEEEIAAQTPGLAVLWTQGKLPGVGPPVFKRQGGIMDLVIELRRKRESAASGWGGHDILLALGFRRGNRGVNLSLNRQSRRRAG